MRHFLTLNDFSKDEILAVTNLALKLKQESSNGTHTPYLKGRILAMIFEKSSTRTRVSFEGGNLPLSAEARNVSFPQGYTAWTRRAYQGYFTRD